MFAIEIKLNNLIHIQFRLINMGSIQIIGMDVV